MKSLLLLVLLAGVAVGNTENAKAEQGQNKKGDARRRNLISELKSLISGEKDETKREPSNVEDKRDVYYVHGGYLDVYDCPKKEYDYWDYYYMYDPYDSYTDYHTDLFSDYYSDYYSYYDYYPAYYSDYDYACGSDYYDWASDDDWSHDSYPSYDYYSSDYYVDDWYGYGSSELYSYYDCGYNLWFDEYDKACYWECACGSNMWYGAKRGAKRVEESKAQERMKLVRSLEKTHSEKRMVARSARRNPAKRRKGEGRIARKGQQNGELNKKHALRKLETQRRTHTGANKKMAAMKSRHEMAANRRMHARNKMTGKENNNGKKMARRKMGEEKQSKARRRMVARKKMAARTKLEARKKMAVRENKKIDEKGNKAGEMWATKNEGSLLERLKARQMKAHEEKTQAVETAKEANKSA